jgi:hypothetical protein
MIKRALTNQRGEHKDHIREMLSGQIVSRMEEEEGEQEELNMNIGALGEIYN